MRRWVWVGGGLWLLRPAYIAVELVVAARATGHSLVHDTVSDLGARTCSSAFCSPWRDLMNGTFMTVGVLLAWGAWLLRQQLGPAVTALLCVAGVSSIATGLTPVDDGRLHVVAAAPLFLCQPLALLLLSRALLPRHGGLARTLLLSGAVTAAAALGFVAGVPGTGVLERLALWLPLVALAAVAVVTIRDPGAADTTARQAERPGL